MRRVLWLTLILVVALTAGLWLFVGLSQPSLEQLLEEAKAAATARRYEHAREIAEYVLEREPRSTTALVIAGQAAAGQQHWEDAVGYLDRIPADAGPLAAHGNYLAGKLLLHQMHRASDAEERFRRALDIEPRHLETHGQLATLLGVEARRWEAVPHILELFRQGYVTVDHLLLLGTRYGIINAPDLLRACQQVTPDDPAVLLGVASCVFVTEDASETERLLRKVVRRTPESAEAQARLGAILLEADSMGEFRTWQQQLPSSVYEHPEIWANLAEWALKHGQPQAAARCYWEALRRDPNHPAALYHLAILLADSHQPPLVGALTERSRRLRQFRDVENSLLYSELSSLQPLREAVGQLETLGRVWEAWGWAVGARQMNPREVWAGEAVDRLQNLLRQNPPLTQDEHNLALRIGLSSYPLPDWDVAGSGLAEREEKKDDKKGNVTFADLGPVGGLNFQYFNSGTPGAKDKKMYEFPGGGVAVLDYDCDGWPDIYLTQGCRWPPREDQSQHLDRLFRNTGTGRFEDTTERANLFENRYSHGVAVGDVNNDGFPDLYVANTGRNRLYQNNGDGTFTDVSQTVLNDAGRWTTSCLIADVSGDGWPDIYSVNYLEADDVFERVCHHADGVPRMCAPFHFPASQDQLFLNSGDGRFEEVTAESGVNVPNGKGLGVLAADFDGSGRLSLFVANDTTANFFFRNETPNRGDRPRFSEDALAVGLGLERTGCAQGCMGIAAGDVNDDGLLDLFIGNFFKESNTLYVQHEGNYFSDETVRAGLVNPSREMLAFGTQFIDGELDGRLDVIVANGHVDDVRAYGRPYQMPPQYFRNTVAGQFEELEPNALGPYFEGRYLGRGVARLDWNRDGREDVVISHLDAPAALLTNTTSPSGHFLAVRLRGVVSDRDAIGTTVCVETECGRFSKQLTAGDGYQASNQRRLVFGLGESEGIANVTVSWSASSDQTFSHVEVNREVLLIEGCSQPFYLDPCPARDVE